MLRIDRVADASPSNNRRISRIAYGYKKTRHAYWTMDWRRAKRSEDKISIQPHMRDRPEYFRDLPPDRTVVVPATDDAIAAGAALRRALSRCA